MRKGEYFKEHSGRVRKAGEAARGADPFSVTSLPAGPSPGENRKPGSFHLFHLRLWGRSLTPELTGAEATLKQFKSSMKSMLFAFRSNVLLCP
jgi:hypothetical protein